VPATSWGARPIWVAPGESERKIMRPPEFFSAYL